MQCTVRMDAGRPALHNQKERRAFFLLLLFFWSTAAFVPLVRLSVKQLFHSHVAACFISVSLKEGGAPGLRSC